MTYPNFPNKTTGNALITSRRYLDYIKQEGRLPDHDPPEGVVICYQPRLLSKMLQKHPGKKSSGIFKNISLLEQLQGKVGLMGSYGIGAPAMAVMVEELAAWGVKKIITVGTAGTLQKRVKIGDLVVCGDAIRDEGTSYHYLPEEEKAVASQTLLEQCEERLRELDVDFFRGTSWTIDAPYRETIEEIAHYQAESILTVDMEASALYAVAKSCGVEALALFSVSDSLAEFKWSPGFHMPINQQSLELAFHVALEVLEQ